MKSLQRYDRFFKEFIAQEPQRRIPKITPELWEMLSDIEDNPLFSLQLISLINTCPDLVTNIIANPVWLSRLNKPWQWHDIFYALRDIDFPLQSCRQFADFLSIQGEKGQLLLERLLDKTPRIGLNS